MKRREILKSLFFLIVFTMLVLVTVSNVQAAFLRNFPVTLTQPDGEQLQCFVSGDEFFNWVHDADGYTIIQDPDTGYYKYAIKKNGHRSIGSCS